MALVTTSKIPHQQIPQHVLKKKEKHVRRIEHIF